MRKGRMNRSAQKSPTVPQLCLGAIGVALMFLTCASRSVRAGSVSGLYCPLFLNFARVILCAVWLGKHVKVFVRAV